MKATEDQLRDAVRNFQEKKMAIRKEWIATMSPFASADMLHALDCAEAKLMVLQVDDDGPVR